MPAPVDGVRCCPGSTLATTATACIRVDARAALCRASIRSSEQAGAIGGAAQKRNQDPGHEETRRQSLHRQTPYYCETDCIRFRHVGSPKDARGAKSRKDHDANHCTRSWPGGVVCTMG
jgi:hypothetical protein